MLVPISIDPGGDTEGDFSEGVEEVFDCNSVKFVIFGLLRYV